MKLVLSLDYLHLEPDFKSLGFDHQVLYIAQVKVHHRGRLIAEVTVPAKGLWLRATATDAMILAEQIVGYVKEHEGRFPNLNNNDWLTGDKS